MLLKKNLILAAMLLGVGFVVVIYLPRLWRETESLDTINPHQQGQGLTDHTPEPENHDSHQVTIPGFVGVVHCQLSDKACKFWRLDWAGSKREILTMKNKVPQDLTELSPGLLTTTSDRRYMIFTPGGCLGPLVTVDTLNNKETTAPSFSDHCSSLLQFDYAGHKVLAVKEGQLSSIHENTGAITKLTSIEGEVGAKGDHRKGVSASGDGRLFYTVGTTLNVVSMASMEVKKHSLDQELVFLHFDDLGGRLLGLAKSTTPGVLSIVAVNKDTAEITKLVDLPSVDLEKYVASTFAPSEKIFAVLFQDRLLAYKTSSSNKLLLDKEISFGSTVPQDGKILGIAYINHAGCN